MEGLMTGEDGLVRCRWHGGLDDYMRYHDTEWGFPVHDDIRLFEKICLEGFQSGLSWLTILRKREAFRACLLYTSPSPRDRRSRSSTRRISSACSATRASCAIAARSSRPSTTPAARSS